MQHQNTRCCWTDRDIHLNKQSEYLICVHQITSMNTFFSVFSLYCLVICGNSVSSQNTKGYCYNFKNDNECVLTDPPTAWKLSSSGFPSNVPDSNDGDFIWTKYDSFLNPRQSLTFPPIEVTPETSFSVNLYLKSNKKSIKIFFRPSGSSDLNAVNVVSGKKKAKWSTFNSTCGIYCCGKGVNSCTGQFVIEPNAGKDNDVIGIDSFFINEENCESPKPEIPEQCYDFETFGNWKEKDGWVLSNDNNGGISGITQEDKGYAYVTAPFHGDVPQLTSPVITGVASDTTISFYLILTPKKESFKVYFSKKDSGVAPELIQSFSGTKNNKWKYVNFTCEVSSDKYCCGDNAKATCDGQFIFEADLDSAGTAAIDTVSVNEGSCSLTTTKTSPTSSVTETPSSAETGTPSSPDTETGTPSSSETEAGTPSSSETDTGTPSSSETDTGTPSSSETEAGTPSSSETDTGTPSSSETDTGTPSSSETDTGTPSSSETEAGTPSSSETEAGTPSSSETDTGTPSSSETDTGTPSSSETDTGTPSSSETEAGTPSSSETEAGTPSSSETDTGTPSSSETDTGTPSSSETHTGTPSSSETEAGTPSSSETEAGTPSSSETEAGTTSSSETDTGTPSSSETDTGTPSSSETEAGTPSSSETEAGTPSSSETDTGTPSSSETDTGTPSSSETESTSSISTFISSSTTQVYTTTPTPDLPICYLFEDDSDDQFELYPSKSTWILSSITKNSKVAANDGHDYIYAVGDGSRAKPKITFPVFHGITPETKYSFRYYLKKEIGSVSVYFRISGTTKSALVIKPASYNYTNWMTYEGTCTNCCGSSRNCDGQFQIEASLMDSDIVGIDSFSINSGSCALPETVECYNFADDSVWISENWYSSVSTANVNIHSEDGGGFYWSEESEDYDNATLTSPTILGVTASTNISISYILAPKTGSTLNVFFLKDGSVESPVSVGSLKIQKNVSSFAAKTLKCKKCCSDTDKKARCAGKIQFVATFGSTGTAALDNVAVNGAICPNNS